MSFKFRLKTILFFFTFFVLLNPLVNVAAFQAEQQNVTSKIRTHLYEVTLNKGLKVASVKICFAGKAPEYLAVDYTKANKNLLVFPVSNDGYLEYQGRFWKTANLNENACIRYKSDISGYLTRDKKAKGKTQLLSFQDDNLWLWLPDKISNNEKVQISFNLPSNYSISTPWQAIDEKAHRYIVGDLSADLGFTLMIGEFELRKIKLEQGLEVNLAMLTNLKQKDNLQNWLVHSLNSVIDYVGKINLSHLQVILIENQQFKAGVVPWGDVRRGGGVGVRFVVNSEKNIDEFYQDWTATHEFSHLLMPKLEDKDLWLSEGLSSYLQYILMAQSGVITEKQAWQKLYAGFQRGVEATKSLNGESLLTTTQRKDNRGINAKTMRSYWTGAAYFFKADWLLRNNSNGQTGLPELLLKFNFCCIDNNGWSDDKWSGDKLSETFDRLSETKIFSRLYKEMIRSSEFPDIETVFNELGIKVKDNNISLLSSGNVQLRKNILLQKNQRK